MSEDTQSQVVEKDFEERVKSFQKEMQMIMGKYEIGINFLPKFTADGRVESEIRLLSTRNLKEKTEKDTTISEA